MILEALRLLIGDNADLLFKYAEATKLLKQRDRTIRELLTKLDARDTEIVSLKAETATLKAENATLKAEIASFKSKLLPDTNVPPPQA